MMANVAISKLGVSPIIVTNAPSSKRGYPVVLDVNGPFHTALSSSPAPCMRAYSVTS